MMMNSNKFSYRTDSINLQSKISIIKLNLSCYKFFLNGQHKTRYRHCLLQHYHNTLTFLRLR